MEAAARQTRKNGDLRVCSSCSPCFFFRLATYPWRILFCFALCQLVSCSLRVSFVLFFGYSAAGYAELLQANTLNKEPRVAYICSVVCGPTEPGIHISFFQVERETLVLPVRTPSGKRGRYFMHRVLETCFCSSRFR